VHRPDSIKEESNKPQKISVLKSTFHEGNTMDLKSNRLKFAQPASPQKFTFFLMEINKLPHTSQMPPLKSIENWVRACLSQYMKKFCMMN